MARGGISKADRQFLREASRHWKDRLPGGRADLSTPSDFDPKALLAGVRVELEHTSDPVTALEIAMDHLTEDADYYEKLAQIDPHHEDLKAELLAW